MAGVAINRLENHLFSIKKLLLDKGIYSFDEFRTAQEELGKHEDLLVYWGVKAAEEPTQEIEEPPQQPSEK